MFWNEDLGAYSVSNGEDRNVFSCHTNILALLYNLVPDDYVQSTLFRVKDHLKKQMDTVDSAEEWGGHVELYFTVYAFRMLAQHNSHDLIETIIKKLFGLMIDRHEPNLWECYCLGLNKLGSQCHGWGATPLIYFTEEYLGVSYPDPGNPNKILIRPASATKQSINGVYPHVKGDIFINWRVDDTDFYLSVTAPTGIDIELDAGAMFVDHTHHFELNSQVLTARLVPC